MVSYNYEDNVLITNDHILAPCEARLGGDPASELESIHYVCSARLDITQERKFTRFVMITNGQTQGSLLLTFTKSWFVEEFL